VKVLQVGKFYFPHHGGIETHLRMLCASLRECVDVEVLVANETRSTEDDLVDGVSIRRLGAALTLASASICPGMPEEIRNAHPDIIHLHHPNPTAMMSVAASRVQCPLVVSYHSDIVRQKALGTLFSPLLRSALARSAVIIAGSPQMVKYSPVLAEYRDKCVVIPYGIDFSTLDAADPITVAELRQQYGPRMILAVGRHVYYKGFEFLIRAMQTIDGRLVLIGDGPLRSALEAEAAHHGVQDRVHFLGGVESVAPFYHAADVFVLPSIAPSEAFGLVQLEAMACGKPVVNTDLKSGVPFVSQHEQTGLTVPPSDSDALAFAVTRLLDNPDLAARYGREGRRRARKEFSAEAMAAKTLELYADVLRGRGTLGRAARAALPVEP
jgi:rhamnosyl/mannosyltransferase